MYTVYSHYRDSGYTDNRLFVRWEDAMVYGKGLIKDGCASVQVYREGKCLVEWVNKVELPCLGIRETKRLRGKA